MLAEFWADGPDSETPPGHWFTIFNYVSDHPLQTKKYKGTGTPLNDLEWGVKGYLALGGAMHDVAITAWGMKGWYDYIRPISAIRAMAEFGQSSDSTALSYHPAGLPLIPGYIELVLPGDPLANGSANVGKIKLFAWRGHSVINNVDTDEAGSGWILAENWMPYQRPSFVTPPFAGFISGHSTYSRAAAEILTDFTGSSYFPGGLGEFTAEQDEFLVFEDGPSQNVTLQWATYQDAADESSMSRIWGGIHPPCDDIPGRLIAIDIAADAFSKAESFFACCQSNAPAKPGAIQAIGGNTKVCPGETKTYFIPSVVGATSYTWTMPVGAIIVNGQGTQTIVVNYTTGFTSNDSLKVVANSGCASSIPRSILIKRNSPATPGVISGLSTGLCNMMNVPYSVTANPGVTQNWNLTNAAGSVIASGQNTNSIAINFSAAFVSGNLTVTANNACGTSAARVLAIKAPPSTPPAITGSATVCMNQQGVPYAITPLANTTAYVWTVPSGARIFDGTTLSTSATLTTPSPSVFVNFKTSPGKVAVLGVNACGSGAKRNLVVAFNCREADDKNISLSQWSISVYPNPSSNDFLVTLSDFEFNAGNDTPSINVIDVLGRKVITESFSGDIYHLKGDMLSPGIYTVNVTIGS